MLKGNLERWSSTVNAQTRSSKHVAAFAGRFRRAQAHRCQLIGRGEPQSRYHGARAEKQGFKIRLEQDFDPAAGKVDLCPQEITRVLLNLIFKNGFYASMKRRRRSETATSQPSLQRPGAS